MNFDSLPYVILLTVVVATYWTLNRREQNVFLVIASYIFYGWWDWRFLLLLWATTSFDYVLSHWMDRATTPQMRRQLLALSIVSNVATLCFFKYFNFLLSAYGKILYF